MRIKWNLGNYPNSWCDRITTALHIDVKAFDKCSYFLPSHRLTTVLTLIAAKCREASAATQGTMAASGGEGHDQNRLLDV